MRQATAQARKEAERIVDEHRLSAGVAFNDTAAKREAIRVVGELMLSHLQAAARQLDSGRGADCAGGRPYGTKVTSSRARATNIQDCAIRVAVGTCLSEPAVTGLALAHCNPSRKPS
ncbi:hypothetical protein [Micromonospora sp. DPT]|uniref:hypothetical protein n=1 Tax=Micromonospora sp. DPT TaxID=3142975 RepID=UPI0032079DE5